MKQIFYIVSILFFIASCNTGDKIFCQGDCPKNQVCLVGTCQCPEGTKMMNEYCYPKSKVNEYGPGTGIYLPVDTNTCGFANTYFHMEMYLPTIKFKDTNSQTINIGDDLFEVLNIGMEPSGIPQSTGNFYLGNDSLYRFGAWQNNIGYGPCKGCQPAANNTLILKGLFNKALDTLSMTYYFSCCNGAIKDTCYKKFYLLK